MAKDLAFLEDIKDELAKKSFMCSWKKFTPNPANVLNPEEPFETETWEMGVYFNLGEMENSK